MELQQGDSEDDLYFAQSVADTIKWSLYIDAYNMGEKLTKKTLAEIKEFEEKFEENFYERAKLYEDK